MVAAINLLDPMASTEASVGQRLAFWLERYSAKGLHRAFGVSVSTASNWKAGNLPTTKHFFAMYQRWGDDFFHFLVAGIMHPPEDVESQLEQVEMAARAWRREIAYLRQVNRAQVNRTGARGAHGASVDADSRPAGAAAGRRPSALSRLGAKGLLACLAALVGLSLVPLLPIEREQQPLRTARRGAGVSRMLRGGPRVPTVTAGRVVVRLAG